MIVKAFESERAFVENDTSWFVRNADWAAHYQIGDYSVRLRSWCAAVEAFGHDERGDQYTQAQCADSAFRGLAYAFELGELSDAQVAFAMARLHKRGANATARHVFTDYITRYRRGRTLLSSALQHGYRLVFGETLTGYGADANDQVRSARVAFESPRGSSPC